MNQPTPAGPQDPVAAWHDIVRAAASAQQHAYVATATRHAEQQQILSDNFHDPLGPINDGDERWCRIALSVYDRLRDLDPFQELEVYRAEVNDAERTGNDAADRVADLSLPLDGPHDPEAIVHAATSVAELVRRLNHATFRPTTLHYPSQLYRVVGGLRAAVYGLDQTLRQLAAQLDRWATDPRVGHDHDEDPVASCIRAAYQLHMAAAALPTVTQPLDVAYGLTSHLSLDDADPRTRKAFPAPTIANPLAPTPSPLPPPSGPSPGRSR